MCWTCHSGLYRGFCLQLPVPALLRFISGYVDVSEESSNPAGQVNVYSFEDCSIGDAAAVSGRAAQLLMYSRVGRKGADRPGVVRPGLGQLWRLGRALSAMDSARVTMVAPTGPGR